MTTPKSPLKAARIKAGFKTQGSFAKAIGLSQSQISNLERGAIESFPNNRTVQKMVQVLGEEESKIYSWFFNIKPVKHVNVAKEVSQNINKFLNGN